MEKTAKEMADEIQGNYDALKTNVETLEKEGATKTEVQEAKDALEAYKNDNTEALKGYVKGEVVDNMETRLKKAEDELKDAQTEIESMKENVTTTGSVSFTEAVSSALKEKHDEIKTFAANKSKGGWLDVVIKAPGNVTTDNVTTVATPADYAASNATSYSEYIREEIFVEEFFDVGRTDKPSIPYVNEEAGEGDAAIVAEGSLKPLIDADFNVKYSQAVKVAGRMKASEESLSDFSWLQAAMTNTLKRKHDIARQNDLITGTSGISNIATPFNVAMLAGITIDTPQNYDVIASMVTAIQVQSEGVFTPNVVFVNNVDALEMKLQKDQDKNYMLPPFIAQDGRVVDGVMVVAKPSLTVGEFIIGDFKNVNLRNYWDYTVRFGWENDDFSKNMITMIGESRYHIYITDSDKRGIIKGTFDAVKTELAL